LRSGGAASISVELKNRLELEERKLLLIVWHEYEWTSRDMLISSAREIIFNGDRTIAIIIAGDAVLYAETQCRFADIPP
jgi:hypothetical protein